MTHGNGKRLTTGILGIVLAAGLAVPTASAQNALGDGQALDRNLGVGSGGRNTQVRDINAQIQRANAVVTGNVPGGAAFRGDIGYTAADEFRATLGSNDLFTFRRDAALSAAAASGIRTTDLYGYRVGASYGMGVPGAGSALLVDRAGTGTSGAQFRPGVPAVTPGLQTGRTGLGGIDLRSRSVGDLRGLESLDPEVIYFQAPGQNNQGLSVTASPLLGVRTQTLNPQTQDLTRGNVGMGFRQDAEPQRPLGAVEPRGLGQQGRDQTADARQTRPEGMMDFGAQTTRVERRSQRHDEIVAEMQRRFEETRALAQAPEAPEQRGPADPDFLADMRQRMRGALDPELDQQAQQDRTLPGERTPEQRRAAAERRAQLARQLGIEMGDDATLDPRALAAIRDAAPQVGTLRPAPDMRENPQYIQNMQEGEELLREERYFDAEDRFVRALFASPGDPMAQAGRINAGLGAGLFMSAASTLRQQLVQYPEFASARFAPGVIPSDDRLENIAQNLRGRIETADERVGQDLALLLAFIGYQRQNEADLRDGLRAMAERVDRSVPEERSVLDLVRAVWVIRGSNGGGAAPAGGE